MASHHYYDMKSQLCRKKRIWVYEAEKLTMKTEQLWNNEAKRNIEHVVQKNSHRYFMIFFEWHIVCFCSMQLKTNSLTVLNSDSNLFVLVCKSLQFFEAFKQKILQAIKMNNL